MRSTKSLAVASAALLLSAGLPVAAGTPFDQLAPNQQLCSVATLLLAVGVVELGLLAVLLLFSVLRPATVRRGGEVLRAHPLAGLLVGLLGLLVFFGWAALMEGFPEPIKGVLIIAVLFVYACLAIGGLGIVACDLGERLQTNLGLRGLGSTAAATLYGGGLIMLLALAPIVGQLLQLTILTLGLGAAMMTVYSGRRKRSDNQPAGEE